MDQGNSFQQALPPQYQTGAQDFQTNAMTGLADTSRNAYQKALGNMQARLSASGQGDSGMGRLGAAQMNQSYAQGLAGANQRAAMAGAGVADARNAQQMAFNKQMQEYQQQQDMEAFKKGALNTYNQQQKDAAAMNAVGKTIGSIGAIGMLNGSSGASPGGFGLEPGQTAGGL